jgi:hypothetical protein
MAGFDLTTEEEKWDEYLASHLLRKTIRLFPFCILKRGLDQVLVRNISPRVTGIPRMSPGPKATLADAKMALAPVVSTQL